MQTQKEQVKNRILSSAYDVFMSFGYENANMRTIAEVAGVPIGNLYRYFKGKEALFSALIDGVNLQKFMEFKPMLEILIKRATKTKDACLTLAEQFIRIYDTYNIQLSLLINLKADCSALYIKKDIYKEISLIISELVVSDNPEIADLLTDSFLYGMNEILTSNEKQTAKKMLVEFTKFYFLGH